MAQKGKPSLKHILRFSGLLNELRGITRVVLVNGERRWENDVEHSYMLAMIAWYLCDALRLRLNRERVVLYALIHDFVEVYAGDTYLYSKDSAYKNSKKEREMKAAKKLAKRFSEFKELHAVIKAYEGHRDKESKFIYALDKLQPILAIYLDKGRTWKKKGISLDMLMEQKTSKIIISPEVNRYYKQILSHLKKHKRTLFGRLSFDG